MLTIKHKCDVYETGARLYNKALSSFEPGLTVLVGCNGSGKSAMLDLIHEHCNKNKIPCVYYDNIDDKVKRSDLLHVSDEDRDIALFSWNSSEGEQIKANLIKWIKNIIKTSKGEKINKSIFDEIYGKKEEPIPPTQMVVLFDACDSGFSIDNIIDLKNTLKDIHKDLSKKGIDVYIITVANEFEMARGEQCYDVRTCKPITFDNYESYRKFVLKSRDHKNKRTEKERLVAEIKKNAEELEKKEKEKNLSNYRNSMKDPGNPYRVKDTDIK